MARHYPRPLHATLTAAVLCLLGASQSLADDDDFCKEFKRGYVTGLHLLHTNDFSAALPTSAPTACIGLGVHGPADLACPRIVRDQG